MPLLQIHHYSLLLRHSPQLEATGSCLHPHPLVSTNKDAQIIIYSKVNIIKNIITNKQRNAQTLVFTDNKDALCTDTDVQHYCLHYKPSMIRILRRIKLSPILGLFGLRMHHIALEKTEVHLNRQEKYSSMHLYVQ